MAKAGKRIGYVDWDLENFHANVYLQLLRGDLQGRGYDVAGCFALRKPAGREWAKKNDVPWFDTPEALDGHVDHYVVLAPGKPEVHEKLCEMVFPFGKTTYVDKTFAPDTPTAERILALADRHRVPMQTTSALRYTAVQAYVREVGRAKVRHMAAWGGGRSFAEYAIHPVELVVSCMGPRVESLMRRGTGAQSQLLLNFSGGRTAVVNVYVKADTPFMATVTTGEATRHIMVDGSTLFGDMAAAILDLFDSGKPSIDRRETLAIRRILDAANRKEAIEGWITV